MMRLIVMIVIGGFWAPCLHAQLFLEVSSESRIRPLTIFGYKNRSMTLSNILDKNGDAVGSSGIALQSEERSVNLLIAEGSQSTSVVEYDDKEAIAAAIAAGAVSEELAAQALVAGEDLTEKLHSTSWSGAVPVPLTQGSGLILAGGASVHNDGENTSHEDYNSYASLAYVQNLSKEDLWSVGLIQATYFGEKGNIMPIGQYTKGFSSGKITAGLIYTAEPIQSSSSDFFEPIVYPFFGLEINAKSPVEIEIVIPTHVSVFTRVHESWTLEASLSLQNRAYRLTQADPWDSSILNIYRQFSNLALGYHLAELIYFTAGVGGISSRQIEFYDKERESFALFKTKDAEHYYLGVALAL